MKIYKNNSKFLNYKKIYEKYKQALDGADAAIWEWNMDSNELFSSDKWEEIVGYNINEFENLFDFIQKAAIAEDKESAINDLNFCIEGKISSYQSKYRIVTKNGAIKWLSFRGKIIKDDSGEIKLISGSAKDITEEKYNEKKIRKIAYYDSLTGLPNRTLFLNNFKEVLKKSIPNSKSGALIFIDLDNFKSINDTLGHNYGDLLLKIFSQLLNICVKGYGQLFRLSGDEFIMLIEEFNSISNLKELCNDILNYCKSPFELNEKQVYITVSIGISIFPEDSFDENELLKYADLAMYKSKLNGKSNYTFFEKSINDAYLRKLSIEHELKSAITNNELYIVYQLQVDAVKNKIVGLEALLRWESSKFGSVSPVEFIPIAEQSGIIIEIGDWVLEKVCNKIYEWKQKEYKFNTISINISPVQIKESDFKNKIIKSCKENKISLKLLELEITEGTLMKLDKEKIEDLNELISKGIKISIDDFGTVYSSLNYLTVLPVNTLKIDKSFIDNIEDLKNKAVIDCILSLSKTLNYKVIAEGVETKEQLESLINSGCNIIQGYYFGKPVSESQIGILFKKN